MTESNAPEATERVLSTMNRDGSRRWLRPKLSVGAFYRKRVVLAWILIGLFTAIPYIRLGGKPLILLNIPAREFTLFGTTFLPTDSLLLMLLLLGLAVGIFLLTALFGRVWCGWACPQMVYLEFLYRPVERLTGGRSKWSKRLGMNRIGDGGRKTLRFVLFVLFSFYLAHTFLAYFVGVEALSQWMRQSPFQHPVAFLVMASTALLMLADFGYFREQVCIVACPYGRFQSVLLDRRSTIVGYDFNRGENRASPKQLKVMPEDQVQEAGDCIDCAACVITCPTGIDIRDGLQMECIGCTQCIDACDAIMDRVGKPRGLIRYTSQDELDKAEKKILRPRVIIYPAIMVLVFGLLIGALMGKDAADVTILRGIGAPFAQLPDGRISNQIRVKIVNRTDQGREYDIAIVGAVGLDLVAPLNPLPVPPGETRDTTVFIMCEPDVFDDGSLDVVVRLDDGAGFIHDHPYRLLGPIGNGGGS